MEITVGKIFSWFFGVIFALGGLGILADSVVAGLITTLVGIFLIPTVRTKIDEMYDVKFSRWTVVLVAIGGLMVAGAIMPSDAGDSTNSLSPSESPDEVVQSYFDSLTGFNQDTESAYEMLSSSVQNETDYADYDTEMKNLKDAQAGATYEMMEIETVSEGNETATVATTISVDMLQGAYNFDESVDLTLEDGEWKIDEKMVPYME